MCYAVRLTRFLCLSMLSHTAKKGSLLVNNASS